MFASLILARVIEDQSLEDIRPLYNGRYKDRILGGRIRGVNFSSRNLDYEDKKRHKVLGIPHLSSMNRNISLDHEDSSVNFFRSLSRKSTDC